MQDFSYVQITEGFVDALRVWSDYLNGQRARTQWGVYGAWYYFTTEFQSVPTIPASAEQIAALARLGSWASNNTPLSTPRAMKKLSATLNAASPFLKAELGLNLTTDTTPGVPISNLSLQDSVNVFQGVYDAASAPIDMPSPKPDPGTEYLAPSDPINDLADPNEPLDVVTSDFNDPPGSLDPPDPNKDFPPTLVDGVAV